MDVFNSYNLKSSITTLNGHGYWAYAFSMLVSANTTYYVTVSADSGYIVFILNDEYQYIGSRSFPNVHYIITIGSYLYITGEYNIWKTDKDVNVLIPYGANVAHDYWGLYYNLTNNLIYVAANSNNSIHVFDLSLNVVDAISIPISYGKPWSISALNNKIYVGCSYQIIVVIENKQVINSFNGCGRSSGSGSVTSIMFDQMGFMATSCSDGDSKIYLYNKNLMYTGLALSTGAHTAYSFGFDSKARFVALLVTRISIYATN